MKRLILILALLPFIQGFSSPESISTRYVFDNTTISTRQIVHNTGQFIMRNVQPKKVEENIKEIIHLPVKASVDLYEGIDDGGKWLLRRVGFNFTGFTCNGCAREQRLMAIANGFKDCENGDITYGWLDDKCTTPAPLGAINSLRITGLHIERVVGRCENPYTPVRIVDGNGPAGVNTERCVTLYGAYYRYNIKANGTESPFYMQPDPCNGRGYQPQHWVTHTALYEAVKSSRLNVSYLSN